MEYKDCGCRDDDYDACPRCEGWSQRELDKMNSDFAVEELLHETRICQR